MSPLAASLQPISWLLLADVVADDEPCSDRSWICFTFGDSLMLLLLPAAVVWALGLIVLYIDGRIRR